MFAVEKVAPPMRELAAVDAVKIPEPPLPEAVGSPPLPEAEATLPP